MPLHLEQSNPDRIVCERRALLFNPVGLLTATQAQPYFSDRAYQYQRLMAAA
jgi:hypothetical protein